jgi:ribosomal protein S18 acetylase RimI-like enzyme
MSLPPGFTIREVDTASDLPAVHDLATECDIEDVGESDVQAWIAVAWASELLRGAWLVHDPRGEVAAYVELESVDLSSSIDGFLPTHPRHREGALRPALLGFVRERARALATGADVTLWVSAPSTDEAFGRAAIEAGFHKVRVFLHMERLIDPAYEPGEPPPGVTIRASIDPDDDRTVHRLLEETFTGHFGIEPMSFEAWHRDFKDELYEPSLVLLAECDGRPVGVATNRMPEGLGWVGELGVLTAHRGRGIGAALLRASFAALAGRGVTKVRLNVDADNATGATRLYGSVGMRTRRSFDVYETRLGGG